MITQTPVPSQSLIDSIEQIPLDKFGLTDNTEFPESMYVIKFPELDKYMAIEVVMREPDDSKLPYQTLPMFLTATQAETFLKSLLSGDKFNYKKVPLPAYKAIEVNFDEAREIAQSRTPSLQLLALYNEANKPVKVFFV